ncbi:hypothetical protein Vafri_1922, partial [Volvox africanus]
NTLKANTNTKRDKIAKSSKQAHEDAALSAVSAGGRSLNARPAGKQPDAAAVVADSSKHGKSGDAATTAVAPWPCRLIIIGKKRMPDPGCHERFFGFVDTVTDSVDQITSRLAAKYYSTRTRGEHTQPAVRVAGRGTYSIMLRQDSRNRSSTQLAYLLQLPLEPGPVQQELGIARSARYVLCIKNPGFRDPGRPTVRRDPQYSPSQHGMFISRGTRWVATEDVSLLDVPGTELLLIGAREQPLEAMGEAAAAHLLDTNRRDLEMAAAMAAEAVAEAVRGLEGPPLAPLAQPAAGISDAEHCKAGEDQHRKQRKNEGEVGQDNRSSLKRARVSEHPVGRDGSGAAAVAVAVDAVNKAGQEKLQAGDDSPEKGGISGGGGGGGAGDGMGVALALAAMLRQELAEATEPDDTEVDFRAKQKVVTTPAETGDWA